MTDRDFNPEEILRIAQAASHGRWSVSRSNGTITTNDFADHTSTVAFAVNIDEEFSRIDIGERDAAFIEAACPPIVIALCERIADLERRLAAAGDTAQNNGEEG